MNCWIAIALTTAVGCVQPEDGVSSEQLSALNWSADTEFEVQGPTLKPSTNNEPSVAPLGTGAVMVFERADCEFGCRSHLEWTYYYQSDGSWEEGYFDVPDATTSARPSVAPFNGTVYVVYASGVDQYLARFDTTTNNFTGSTLLPFTSLGAAAIAPYGGKLVFVRAEPTQSGKLYWRTMDTAGNFSAEQPITRAIDGSGCGHTTTQRPVPQAALTYYEFATGTPALAAYGSCLYLVHRDGATNNLVYNTFGGSWGTELAIPNGPGGAQQTSAGQPAIAAFGGALHMVHASASGDVDWSTLDSTGWSIVQTVPDTETHGTPSLAGLSDRLLMVHEASVADTDGNFGIWWSTYHNPITRLP